MKHVVLLGDSIFDNARYVPDRPPVIEQLRRALPAGWQATLLAVDGNVTTDVSEQLEGLPPDASHLIVSVGGNDALGESGILNETVSSVAKALFLLNEAHTRFQGDYRTMLAAVTSRQLPTAVCTIYDAIPTLGPPERTALAAFNDVILREAFELGLPVIDLRLVCKDASDYSPLSPIEPSVTGGLKITRAIAELLMDHDFSRGRSVVYA
jgi:hypothetical protein